MFSHADLRLCAYCAGTAAQAASGICVSFGWNDEHAMTAEPRRQPVDQEAQISLLFVRAGLEVGGFSLGAFDMRLAPRRMRS